MSCFGPLYNPNPTREWYRFDNQCVFDTDDNIDPDEQIYVPMLKRYVSKNSLEFELAVLKKGNILQYKKNSSNITKQQRYAQIARGNWTNRTTTWATQTESYTNPNTNMLQRVNYSNITAAGAPTIDPITRCPILPFKNYGGGPLPLSSNSNGNGNNPVLPPPPPLINNPSNQNVLPPLPPTVPVIIPDIVIPDGGTLVCNTYENPCTGELYVKVSARLCNPTSASDVPGPIMELCYDDSLPTYYPKTRRTYLAGGDKWPFNAKFKAGGEYINNIDAITKSQHDIKSNLEMIDDFIKLIATFNELYSLYLSNKISQLSSILTPEYYLIMTKQIVGVQLIIANITNNKNANETLTFFLKSLEVLYKATTQYESLTSLQNQNTIAENNVAYYKNMLGNMDLLKQYLLDKQAAVSKGLSDLDAEVTAISLSIDPVYITYIKIYGYPSTGVFDTALLVEARTLVDNANKATQLVADAQYELTIATLTATATSEINAATAKLAAAKLAAAQLAAAAALKKTTTSV